jgi:hypothetical protein
MFLLIICSIPVIQKSTSIILFVAKPLPEFYDKLKSRLMY